MRYLAEGDVLGLDWMGKEVVYKAAAASGKTLKELRKSVKARLKDGSLDSGFGFERLLGARMDIYKVYQRKSPIGEVSRFFKTEFFGDLTPTQKEFIKEMMR